MVGMAAQGGVVGDDGGGGLWPSKQAGRKCVVVVETK